MMICGRRSLTAAILAAVLFLAAACRQAPEATRRYDLTGTVVKVDGRQVTIAHERIPGYMDAMVMPFRVKEQWAYGVLEAGDTVKGSLVVADGEAWIEQIIITKVPAPSTASVAPGAAAGTPVGTQVPDFELVNQDARPLRLRDFRGRALLVTFIYTRCPLPEFCPWVSQRFADIEKRLRENTALYDRTRLLTISFDPAHDSPDVMRQYARRYGAATAPGAERHWEFATGSEDQIKAVTSYFGLEYWQETNQIVHALQTVLVAPDGTVSAVYPGNDWKVDDVLEQVATVLEKGSAVRTTGR